MEQAKLAGHVVKVPPFLNQKGVLVEYIPWDEIKENSKMGIHSNWWGMEVPFIEYAKTLNSEQHLIIRDCLLKADTSAVAKKILSKLRTLIAQRLAELWGESMPQYQQIKCGLSPDWGNMDIDWQTSFDGMSFPGNPVINWFLLWSGLDVAILNLALGTKIPKLKSKMESQEVAIAIAVAAIYHQN